MQSQGESAANIAHHLRGINFPCSKSDLVNHCRQRGCPTDVLNTLQSLPDRQYNSMADVMSGVGQVE